MSSVRLNLCRQLVRLALVLAFALLAAPPSARAAQLLLDGHYDVSPIFTNAPGGGWSFKLYDFATLTRFDPRPLDIGLNANARLLAPGSSAFARLGAVAGQPVWVMPQIQTAGVLFFGVRTDDVQPSAFASDFFGPGFIALSLVDVRGSGPDRGGAFSMYQTGLGNPAFHFSTADGITSSDQLAPIPLPAHAHYNWAFTQPGEYQVTFRFTGTLAAEFGGTVTNGLGTINFFVQGETNRHFLADGHMDLRVDFTNGAFAAFVDADGLPDLPPDTTLIRGNSLLRATVPANPAFAFLGTSGAPVWVFPQSNTPGLPYIGLSAEQIGPGVLQNNRVKLTLTAVNGPPGGGFTLFQVDAFGSPILRLSSLDGLDPVADSLLLSTCLHDHYNWAFTQAGEYTLTFLASGTLNSGGSVTSAPIVLRFAVDRVAGFVDANGNGLDDHWEARHGATASNPATDPDGDGRSNRIEYLLGTDPLVADAPAAGLLTPQRTGNMTQLSFDTREGRLYRVMYSDNLQTWQPATPWLLGARERQSITDTGTGLTPPPGVRRFYRLDITTP